ncbi:MAG: ATP-dependent DNA helicase RecG, partial [Actinomycetota bacterium]|nr:ATP-dependent DNA helicase RecG [Actinomycetota bacterium]
MSDVGPDPRTVELERRLGPASAKAFATLGIRTVGELLRHYPRRYAEPGRLTQLDGLQIGEHVTVLARIESTTVRSTRTGGQLVKAVITDGRHKLDLTFFTKGGGRGKGLARYYEERFAPGRSGLFQGTVNRYQDRLQLLHPDARFFGEDLQDGADALVESSRPLPIYAASAKVSSWKIAKAVATLLGSASEDELLEPIPQDVRERHGLLDVREALRAIHQPFTMREVHVATHRFRFEEAFVLQAALARRRAIAQDWVATPRPARSGGLLEAFESALPFTLTAGQHVVGEEIQADLARSRPMQRLLQGEVGSGKTVVALRAMAQVVDAGGQAALLAPTEVLAAQHVRSLEALLGPLARGGQLDAPEHATRVVLLTGSQGQVSRREALAAIADGSAGIVVGTHALLSESVEIPELGLVVVDEQHRFGVEQRDALRARAETVPHLLVMTATPIPRTVAMTVFGDLAISTLAELPAGRAEVETHVVPASNTAWLDRAWQRVGEEVRGGGRAYVVCARIEPDARAGEGAAPDDGADLDLGELAFAAPRPPLRAVLDVADELRANPNLAGIEVGVLHGRMGASEKDRAMARLSSGEAPVLVSTTVVEVGVDVPQATVMVVLDADRFGIAQLHQLR